MMTVIEKQCMDAVIAMNRKMADQNKPDWEQRRYEIAKAVFAASVPRYIAKCEELAEVHRLDPGDTNIKATAVELAVELADALVAELKKEKENQSTTI